MKPLPLLLLALAAAPVARAVVDDSVAWKAEQARLERALAASPRPRERILAASMPAPKSARSTAAIAEASAAAPDDALVQWIAAVHGNVAATAALTRLEPDNGASWLPALGLAVEQGDGAGVDSALAGLAASTRFDDHQGQLLHAWQDALRRQPDAPACVAGERCERAERDFLVASEFTAASVFPFPQAALAFCKAAPANTPRHRQCEAGARGMLDNGRTLVSKAVGYSLLGHLHALTPADEEERRRQDWLATVTEPMLRGDLAPGSAEFAAFMADWTALDSEMEVLRRGAQRAAQPVLPPDGWISPHQRARDAAKARGKP